ncbi:DNA-directed RNA polymerase I subunit RPA1-like, partial [Hyalella azteca]|uniref:DNA-directed RNA polymerase n=1 Tax=Hyalella azteca TaxID=294128 RepID=A0A8B7P700_HYAAZ
MRLMVDSGAKGSKVNMNQMASLFGPTALDGKRMPLSLAGKSLPSFLPYDMNPRAGGYISTRFMTGIDPQSYFFLCIVGRDFEYGEDGLDVTKAPFLKSPKILDVVVDNCVRQLHDSQLQAAQDKLNNANISKHRKKVRKYLKKQRKLGTRRRCSAFTIFCEDQENCTGQHDAKASTINSDTGRSRRAQTLLNKWNELDQDSKLEYENRYRAVVPVRPDPVLSRYCGHSNVGVMSEVLDDFVESYYNQQYAKRDAHHKKYDRQTIETTVAIKARSAHVDPGEAVGAICAQ